MKTFLEVGRVREIWRYPVKSMVGEVHIRLNQRISRCQMVNVDPDTAVRDARVLKVVAQSRDNCAGVGCTPEKTGVVQVGDVVRLLM